MNTELIKQIICWIHENYESVVLANGYETAFLGVSQTHDGYQRAVYDIDKCIETLINQGMSFEDAQEYFEYNTLGSYIGEETPIFIERFKPKKLEVSKNTGKIYAEQFEFKF